ncbi:MAG: ankyrin repeat domain-containing protein, partial [Arenimonas sp.]
MVELPRALRALAWALPALILSLLPLAWPAQPAWIGLLLAQPLWQEAWRRFQGVAATGGIAAHLARLTGPLALWALGAGLLALAMAWPLAALRASGDLAPAMVLSLFVGSVWLGLWRLAPAFVRAAREGGPLRALLAVVPGIVAGAHAFAIAAAVLAVLALGLALAWPGLVPAGWRMPGLLLHPVLAVACHIAAFRAGAFRASRPILPVTATINAGPDAPAATAGGELEPDARLYAALREGRIEAALAALDSGASPLALPASGERDQRTLPMLATLLGDMRPLRRIIAAGADLNRDHQGLTPLLAATRDSWHGRPEAVMTLLANGADARATDPDGNTPLHHAARSSDPAVAALLLDAGALVDALNGDGQSSLGLTCAAGNWRLARFLLEHGARPEPVDGQPALLAAAGGEDDPAGVQLLLRH